MISIKKIIIKGPMVCAMKLFSGTSAFEESIQTKVVSHNFDKSAISKDKRVGLGLNSKANGADELNYRFFIDPKE